MVLSKDEMALVILKRIQDRVSCGICNNLITNPMRNLCGHRFCYYCIVNALDPAEDICNCPSCNAAINRNRLVQDVAFGKVVNKASQVIDSIKGSELSSKPTGTKDLSPMGKRRLPLERNEEIDLDKSIEEAEAEAREMARDITENKGTKRPLENANEHVDIIKKPFIMPKTSTPSGSGKEKDLSPFPVSFLNKFTLQTDKRPLDKQASPSPKRPREPLNRKLSFEGEERREGLMSDSSDSEDRRIRSGATYSRFDRVKQSIKRSYAVQTETLANVLNRTHQSQQTDGTNNSDLYSTLSNLFNCLCTQHGVQGSINIEGVGRFEINLSKPTTEQNVDLGIKSQVSMFDKPTQTDPEPFYVKPILVEKCINTNSISTKESEVQTEPSIGEASDKDVSQKSNEYNPMEPEKDCEITELVTNVNGATRVESEKLGELEASHEVASISQIVKEFSEDPIDSQELTNGDLSRYDHIKASTRISALNRVDITDSEATELVTKAVQNSTTKEVNDEESDIEDDEDESRRNGDDIVPESDEDDKFLMSCVMDTIDDDELESVRSIGSSSARSSGRALYLSKTPSTINDSDD